MTVLPTYTHGDSGWHLIPPHMVDGLRRYIENGIIPGDFLSAVLTNDLRGAVMSADHINRRVIPDYINFLYNHAPAGCSGSPENVEAWSKKKGLGWPPVT